MSFSRFHSLVFFLLAVCLFNPSQAYADTVYDLFSRFTRSEEDNDDYFSVGDDRDINNGVSDAVLNKVIKYNVICDNKEIKENIEAYLSTLPEFKRLSFNKIGTSAEKIDKKVRDAVKVFGYYNPSIKMKFKNKKSKILTVAVDLRKPVWIRNARIEVIGEGLTDPVLMSVFRKGLIKSHTVLSHEAYENLKSKMLAMALTRGYLDAHFIKSKVYANVDENCADMALILNTGRRYRLGEITFSGDTRYLPTVEPVIGISAGENLSTDKLSGLSSRLYDTGYFADVEVHPLLEETDNYKVPINVHIERKKFNVVELGLGYATDDGIRGKVKWNMPLLNEHGDSLLLQTEVSHIRQEFLARYKIPFKNPLTDYFYIQGQQSHESLNDTNENITSGQVHYATKEYAPWVLDMGYVLQYEDYRQGIEKGNSVTSGPSFKVNFSRSYPRMDVRKGESYTFKTFASSTGLGADVTFLQLYGSAKWLFSPTRNSRFIMRFEQGVNLGDDYAKIPPYYRFFVGGDSSVRGFGYKTVSDRDVEGNLKGGRYMTTGSMEVQLPVIEDLRSAWFIDAGQATNKYEDKNTVIGVGTGIRYVSPVGIIKVDFGFGVSEKRIPFRLHFGIGPDI